MLRTNPGKTQSFAAARARVRAAARCDPRSNWTARVDSGFHTRLSRGQLAETSAGMFRLRCVIRGKQGKRWTLDSRPDLRAWASPTRCQHKAPPLFVCLLFLPASFLSQSWSCLAPPKTKQHGFPKCWDNSIRAPRSSKSPWTVSRPEPTFGS